MRIRRLPLSLLLLGHTLSLSVAEPIPENEVARAVSGANDAFAESGAQLAPRVAPRGTSDAPVDGQDGKPHAGPFVETSADRDRNKADLNVDEDLSRYNTKRVEANGDKIPTSNDGVMDDRTRILPKDGTRGTEGGVSEKSKDSQIGVERTPDSPKEAPPLPNSEYGKIPGTEYLTKPKNSDVPLEVWR